MDPKTKTDEIHVDQSNRPDASTLLESCESNATPFTGFVSEPVCDTSAGSPVPKSPATAATERTLAEGTDFGRYRLLRLLGQGGMGRVFLAHDQQLERNVAIKMPKGSSAVGVGRERFLREARAAALLRHPNICPIYDVGELDGQCYMTMAFIEGQPLTRHAKPESLLPQRQVAQLIHKLATAIHEAHEHGVVHRDLKPDNIMLDSRDEPIVMDFGLARRENSGDATLTREGDILGTPSYMSPEQVAGDIKAIGPQSDVYSLGVILYEMLTGHRPFQGSATIVMAKILRDTAPAPSSLRHDVEPKLEWVCWKALEKKLTSRYRSAAEMADALKQFLSSSATTTGGLSIRAPTKTIAAPSEEVGTYQLDLVKTPEVGVHTADTSSTLKTPATRPLKTRIVELIGESDLAKSLLKFAAASAKEQTIERLTKLLQIGRGDIAREFQEKQFPKAIRIAAAMHLGCNRSESLALLTEVVSKVAHARWDADQPATSLEIWDKVISAFRNEESLKKQAALFAHTQAMVALKAKNGFSALALCHQALQWTATEAYRSNYLAVCKKVAAASIKSGRLEQARKLCDEALKIAPDDEELKQLRERTINKR